MTTALNKKQNMIIATLILGVVAVVLYSKYKVKQGNKKFM